MISIAKKILCGKCGKYYNFNEKCSCNVINNRNEYQKQYYRDNRDIQLPLMSRRWQKKRKYIINRDNGYCQRCFCKFRLINDQDLQVHHIKPRSKYPELMYEDDNLITLCRTCNLELGVQEQLDFTPRKNDEQDFSL